jgi:hypothetical protein
MIFVHINKIACFHAKTFSVLTFILIMQKSLSCPNFCRIMRLSINTHAPMKHGYFENGEIPISSAYQYRVRHDTRMVRTDPIHFYLVYLICFIPYMGKIANLAFIINRTPSFVLKGMSPFEFLYDI